MIMNIIFLHTFNLKRLTSIKATNLKLRLLIWVQYFEMLNIYGDHAITLYREQIFVLIMSKKRNLSAFLQLLKKLQQHSG